jgi:hypothetical protein
MCCGRYGGEQQHNTWQTCINNVDNLERHKWQTGRTNVPHPKGEPSLVREDMDRTHLCHQMGHEA